MKKRLLNVILAAFVLSAQFTACIYANETHSDQTINETTGETASSAVSPLTQSVGGAGYDMTSAVASAVEKSSASTSESEALTLMTSEGDTLSGGEVIDSGGTYYITAETTGTITIDTSDEVILEGLNLFVQSDSPSEIRAAHNLSIEYICEAANLTLNNVAIIEPDPEKNVIKFIGEDNLMKIAGVNLLELDSGAGYKALVHIIDDEDEDGITDSLMVRSADLSNPGTLYAYKRGAGAGFGSDGGEVSACNGKLYFGADAGDKMRIFGKTSKMGAFIGNGAYCPEIPNEIVFNGGIYYLESNARGSIIGGAAGESASEAGVVIMNGGTFNLNVDYSGAAVGSGGDAGINTMFGGYLMIGSASLRTFINHNAGSQWSSFGASDAGVNDACITAEKKALGGEGMSVDQIEELEDVYALKFDTSMITAPSLPGSDYDYDIKCEEYPDFNYCGDGYNYYYLNETLYKQEQISIGTTYQNWKDIADLPENRRDTNLYFYLPGEDITLTVNDEESFEYEFIPVYDNLGNVSGGSFRLVRAANSVSGGDVISDGGTYIITDSSPGTVTVNTSEEVRLMTSEEVRGISVEVSSGRTPDIILDGVELVNDSGSVFSLGSGSISIEGHNILKGNASSAGNPTLSVSDDITISGNTQYDKLDISAGKRNAAVEVAQGGSFIQNGGTVMVVKTGIVSGSAKAAVSAEGADFIINDGSFYGTTNTSGVPVIYSGSFGALTEGTITAQAYANQYAVCSSDWNLTLGSIKLTGNNGANVNAAAAYDTDDGSSLKELGTFEAYACDVSNLMASGGSGVYTCWADDNTSPDNRIYYGIGHRFTAAENGTTFVEYENSDINNENDPCVYFWFNSDSGETHTLYVNDNTMGDIYWTSEGWSIDAPAYDITISTPQTGFIKNQYPLGGSLTNLSATQGITTGDTVTGNYVSNEGYGLREIRYYYYIGHTQKNYSLAFEEDANNPGTGSFSFEMPGAPTRLEAIWGENRALTVTNEADDAVIDGIQTGETALENITFTVTCDDPCVVIARKGTSIARVSGRPSLTSPNTYSYMINTDNLSEVIVIKRGDVNRDGSVTVQDVTNFLTLLKSDTPLDEIGHIIADTNNDGSLTVLDADRCMKSIYRLE